MDGLNIPGDLLKECRKKKVGNLPRFFEKQSNHFSVLTLIMPVMFKKLGTNVSTTILPVMFQSHEIRSAPITISRTQIWTPTTENIPDGNS